MQISERLAFIQKQVSADSKIVYDLCCDHGKIGEYFLSYGQEVVFVDQVESIIKKLKERISNLSSDIPKDKAHFLHENAKNLKIQKTTQKKTIVLAGIGGKLSISILKNVIPQLNSKDEIILSAQSEILTMRQFLAQSNCTLIDETLIRDNHKFYEVIKLGFEGEKRVTPFGEDIWKTSSLDICNTYIKELCEYYELKQRHNPKYKLEFLEYSKIAHNLRQSRQL